jgi:hypothetical protein
MGQRFTITESERNEIRKQYNLVKEEESTTNAPRYWDSFLESIKEWGGKVSVSPDKLQVTYNGAMYTINIVKNNGNIDYTITFSPQHEPLELLKSINNAYFASYRVDHPLIKNIFSTRKDEIPNLKNFKSSLGVIDLGNIAKPGKRFFEELFAIDSNPTNQTSFDKKMNMKDLEM